MPHNPHLVPICTVLLLFGMDVKEAKLVEKKLFGYNVLEKKIKTKKIFPILDMSLETHISFFAIVVDDERRSPIVFWVKGQGELGPIARV